MLWLKKKEQLQEDKPKQKTLADELSNIADTSGFENMEERVNNIYENILSKIKTRADAGLHKYDNRDEDYMTSNMYFIRNTNANRVLYGKVIERFKKNGFNGYWEEHGNDYLRIIIKW